MSFLVAQMIKRAKRKSIEFRCLDINNFTRVARVSYKGRNRDGFGAFGSPV